jgi:hypothetical protein
MAELKTKPTDTKVEEFLKSISDERLQKESFLLLDLMKSITKSNPKIWGKNIVGFGSYHYKYESKREGDWFVAGFSPRKKNLTIYVMAGFVEYEDLLIKLGKHSIGKSCLYINSLEEIDLRVLKELIKKSIVHIKSKYKTSF